MSTNYTSFGQDPGATPGLGNLNRDVFATPLHSLSFLDQLGHDVSLSEARPIVMLFLIPLSSIWGPFLAITLGGGPTSNLKAQHIHRAFQ